MTRSAWTRRLSLTLALLMPAMALPEGAVKLLDCTVTRVCDAAGVCEPGSRKAVFRMEPIQLGAGGAGTFMITYAGTEAEMTAMSEVGPFLWAAGSERNALIVSSRTEWLWHQLTVEPTTKAAVRFLSCTFQG